MIYWPYIYNNYFGIGKESKIETPETQSPANSLSMSGSSSLVNTLAIAGSSVAWKLLKRKVIRPEVRAINQLLEGYKDESRSYVLNPKYTSPASLPLYFYFGYQLLHESKHMKASGHVSPQYFWRVKNTKVLKHGY